MQRFPIKNLFVLVIGIFACLLSFSIGKKQVRSKVCFNLLDAKNLIIGIDNHIEILAEQDSPVQLEQVSVSGNAGIEYDSTAGDIGATIKGSNGEFVVRVDSFGLVDFKIKTKSGTVKKTILAVPIPAVPYFGRSKGGKMNSQEFRVQAGIRAVVECCGFDARCQVVGYAIIRITKDNRVERVINQGGRLSDANQRIIETAEPGDIYWFRNITYQCPGTKEPQKAEDLSIEID